MCPSPSGAQRTSSTRSDAGADVEFGGDGLARCARAIRHHRHVHGCADELIELLGKLGYAVRLEGFGDARRTVVRAPKGRRAFFVGDLVDRGPNSPDVLRIVMDMAERGHAFAVIGNHDDKFLRWLKGRNVKIANGLGRSIAQLDGEGDALKARALAFLDMLPSHAWVDDCNLAIAHAGVGENMLGSASPATAPAAPRRTAYPSASAGRRTMAARPPSSTATRRSPSPNGSTIRCASTPAACSVAA